MLNFKAFMIGEKRTVCEHTCTECGHKSIIIFGRGFENKRSFLVGPEKYQCDCDHSWVRYVCPVCRSKQVAQSNRRRVPGDNSANSTWAYREITEEDLKRYLRDYGKKVTVTKDQNDWIEWWGQPS
ncbi:MAG: hypothetical protein J6U54_01190 [Clostridiales bacterium]|nr:hypothetical protein [Clostridiales bacterium]